MPIARLQVIAAAVLFSTGGAAIKTAAFTAIQVSSFRAGIAALVLLVWIRGRIVWSWPMLGVAGVYAATLTLFATSTKLTTAANAIFLQSTAPLYIVVLGPLLLGERLRRRDVIYLLAAGTGLALCFAARPEPTLTAPDPELGKADSYAEVVDDAGVRVRLDAPAGLRSKRSTSSTSLPADEVRRTLATLSPASWAKRMAHNHLGSNR